MPCCHQLKQSCHQQRQKQQIYQKQSPTCCYQSKKSSKCCHQPKQSSTCCHQQKQKQQICQKQSSTCCHRPKPRRNLLQKLSSKCQKRSIPRQCVVQKQSSVCCIQPKPIQIVVKKRSSICCNQPNPKQIILRKRSSTCCNKHNPRQILIQKRSSTSCSQELVIKKPSSTCCSRLKPRQIVVKRSTKCSNNQKPRQIILQQRSSTCCNKKNPRQIVLQKRSSSCCSQQNPRQKVVQKRSSRCCSKPKQRQIAPPKRSPSCCSQSRPKPSSSSCCSRSKPRQSVIPKRSPSCCSQSKPRQIIMPKPSSSSCCSKSKPKRSPSCCSQSKPRQIVIPKSSSSSCCIKPKPKRSPCSQSSPRQTIIPKPSSSSCCSRSKPRQKIAPKKSSSCCSQSKPKQLVARKGSSSSCGSRSKWENNIISKRRLSSSNLSKLKRTVEPKSSSLSCSSQSKPRHASSPKRSSSSCCSEHKSRKTTSSKQSCTQSKPRPTASPKRSSPCCNHPEEKQTVFPKKSSSSCCIQPKPRQTVSKKKSSSSCCIQPKPRQTVSKKKSSSSCCSREKNRQTASPKQSSSSSNDCDRSKLRQTESPIQSSSSSCDCSRSKKKQTESAKSSSSSSCTCSRSKKRQTEEHQGKQTTSPKQRSPCCGKPKEKPKLPQKQSSTCCTQQKQSKQKCKSHDSEIQDSEDVTDCVQELRCKIRKLTKLLDILECNQNQKEETCDDENNIAMLKNYTRKIRKTIRQILNQVESNEKVECSSCQEKRLLEQQNTGRRQSQCSYKIETCDNAGKRKVDCGQFSSSDPADVEVIKTGCETNPLLMRRTGYKGVDARQPPGAARRSVPQYRSFIATQEDYDKMAAEIQKRRLRRIEDIKKKCAEKEEEHKSSISSLKEQNSCGSRSTSTAEDDVIVCSSLEQEKDTKPYRGTLRTIDEPSLIEIKSSPSTIKTKNNHISEYNLEDEESSYSLPKKQRQIFNGRRRTEDDYNYYSSNRSFGDSNDDKYAREINDDDCSLSSQISRNTLFNSRRSYQETQNRLDLEPNRDPREDPRLSFLPLSDDAEVNRRLKKEVAKGRPGLKWDDSNHSFNNKNSRPSSTHRVHYSDEDEIYYTGIGEKSTACQCDLPYTAILDMSEEDLRQKCHGFTYDDLDTIYKRDILKLKSQLTQVTGGFKFKKKRIESPLVPKRIVSQKVEENKINENNDESDDTTPDKNEPSIKGDVEQDADEKKVAYNIMDNDSVLPNYSYRKYKHETKYGLPLNFLRLGRKKHKKIQEMDSEDAINNSPKMRAQNKLQNDILIVEAMSNNCLNENNNKIDVIYKQYSKKKKCNNQLENDDNESCDNLCCQQKLLRTTCETCGDKICPGMGTPGVIPKKKLLITGLPEKGTNHPTCSCLSKEEYKNKCKEKVKCTCKKKKRRDKSICDCPKPKKCPKDMPKRKNIIIPNAYEPEPEKKTVERKRVIKPEQEKKIDEGKKVIKPEQEKKIDGGKKVIEPVPEMQEAEQKVEEIKYVPEKKISEHNRGSRASIVEYIPEKVEVQDGETQADEIENEKRINRNSAYSLTSDDFDPDDPYNEGPRADACECRRKADECECDKVDCGCAGPDDDGCKCSEQPSPECCKGADEVFASGFKLSVKQNTGKSLFC